ncbi:MAG: coenzyme pyrophosphatase [Frankiales bacterium]|nr:coenzyme pyrophosphatase [Frankiales bacterium]
MIPDWLRPLADAIPTVQAEHFSRVLPPPEGGRDSAVLLLFGEGVDGPDLLLIERAHTLRKHAGQPAFPGGARDPEDATLVDAALREAHEEVGLDPASVDVIGVLPALYLPPSGFVVHPVVAWWREPHPVHVVDEAEVAAVVRVPLAELADPANRHRVGHVSGLVGPAFRVRDLMVWGFTAGLLAGVLSLGGWERPWDEDDVRELDPETLRLAMRTWQPTNPG